MSSQQIGPMKEAREVKVSVDHALRVTGVIDSAYKSKLINQDVEYGGEVYRWRLEPIVKEGISSPEPAFQTMVHISPNSSSDKTDRNTVSVRPAELIKLDCGYWGSYWRDRKAAD